MRRDDTLRAWPRFAQQRCRPRSGRSGSSSPSRSASTASTSGRCCSSASRSCDRRHVAQPDRGRADDLRVDPRAVRLRRLRPRVHAARRRAMVVDGVRGRADRLHPVPRAAAAVRAAGDRLVRLRRPRRPGRGLRGARLGARRCAAACSSAARISCTRSAASPRSASSTASRAAPCSSLLHTQGDQAQKAAIVLADIVLSPLLYIGGALLYLDQAARADGQTE